MEHGPEGTFGARLAYLVRSMLRGGASAADPCPACGAASGATFVEQKYLAASLRECGACGLRYRCPVDRQGFASRFYQGMYKSGMTTALPSEEEVESLLRNGTGQHPKDRSPYVSILSRLGVPAHSRVLDFGCSWGYEMLALRAAGFDAVGYELNDARRAFARERLGCQTVDSVLTLEGEVDVFFSVHVLEHIPGLMETFAMATRVLRPGGLFVAFTPNGSEGYRRLDRRAYRKSWGLAHPVLLTPHFFKHMFGDSLMYVSSREGHPLVDSWLSNRKSLFDDPGGSELLGIAEVR